MKETQVNDSERIVNAVAVIIMIIAIVANCVNN